MGGVESSPEEREKSTEDTQTKESWKLFGGKDTNKKTENVKTKKTKKATLQEKGLSPVKNPTPTSSNTSIEDYLRRYVTDEAHPSYAGLSSVCESSLSKIREDVSFGASFDGALRDNANRNSIRHTNGYEDTKVNHTARELQRKQQNGWKTAARTTHIQIPDAKASPATIDLQTQNTSGQICSVKRCHHVSCGIVPRSGVADLTGPKLQGKGTQISKSSSKVPGQTNASSTCRSSSTPPMPSLQVSEKTSADKYSIRLEDVEATIARRSERSMAEALQACFGSTHDQISLDSTTQSSSNKITTSNSTPSRNTSNKNSINLLDLDLDLPDDPCSVQPNNTPQKTWLKINKNQKIGNPETERTQEPQSKLKGVQENSRQKRQESFNKQRKLAEKQEHMEKLRQQVLQQQQKNARSINYPQHNKDINVPNIKDAKSKSSTNAKEVNIMKPNAKQMKTKNSTNGNEVKSKNSTPRLIPKAMRWMSSSQTGILPVHIQVTEHEKRSTNQASLKAQLFSKPGKVDSHLKALNAADVLKIKQLPGQTVRFLTGVFFRNRTAADIPSCVIKISKPLQPGEVPVCFLIREHRQEFGIGCPSEDEVLEYHRLELFKARFVAKLLGWNAFQGSLHHFYQQNLTLRSTEFPRLTSCTNKAKSETTKRIKVESTAETSKLTKKQRKRLTKARNKTEKENEARLKKLISEDLEQKKLDSESGKSAQFVVTLTTLTEESKPVLSNSQASSKQFFTTDRLDSAFNCQKKTEDRLMGTRTNNREVKVNHSKPAQPKPESKQLESEAIRKSESIQADLSFEGSILKGVKSDTKATSNVNNVTRKTDDRNLLSKKHQINDITKDNVGAESHKQGQNTSSIHATGDASTILHSSGDTKQVLPNNLSNRKAKEIASKHGSDQAATKSSAPMILKDVKFTPGIAGPPIRRNKNRKRPDTRNLDKFMADEEKDLNGQSQNFGKLVTDMKELSLEKSSGVVKQAGDGKQSSGTGKQASGHATSTTKSSDVIKQKAMKELSLEKSSSVVKQAGDGKQSSGTGKQASGPATSTTKSSDVIQQKADSKQLPGTASSKQASNPGASATNARNVHKQEGVGKQATTASSKQASSTGASATNARNVHKQEGVGKQATTASSKQASNPGASATNARNVHNQEGVGKQATIADTCNQTLGPKTKRETGSTQSSGPNGSTPKAGSVIKHDAGGKQATNPAACKHTSGPSASGDIKQAADSKQAAKTEQTPARPVLLNQFGKPKLKAKRLIPTQTNTKRNLPTLYVVRFCLACADTKQPDGKPLMPCTKCEEVFYCSRVCLSNNWNEHKLKCKWFRSKCNRCITFQKKAQS